MKHCIDTQLNLKSILETTGTTYKFKKKVEKKKKYIQKPCFFCPPIHISHKNSPPNILKYAAGLKFMILFFFQKDKEKLRKRKKS